MPSDKVSIRKYRVLVPYIDVSHVGERCVLKNTATGDTNFMFSIPCIRIPLLQTCMHWFELQYCRHISLWHRDATPSDQELRGEMFVCVWLHV